MGSEWKTDLVSNIADPAKNSLAGGPFGSNLVSADYTATGIPVIRGQNMGSGRWVDGEFAFVSKEKAESLSVNLAKPGDIVFTQRGTLGQVAIVPKDKFDTYLLSQSQMKLTVDSSKADSLFIYYVFTSQPQQDYIRQHAIQTGVPHTNLGILKNTPLRLPPPHEQRAIARVLGSLDDKIELNRKMNATLEETARAIFQSWFVDFDPVRAKAAGQSPVGLDAATAALFPAAFEEVDERMVPQGWEVGKLEDLMILQRGFDLPATHRVDGIYPVLAASGPSGTHNECKVKGPGVTTGRSGLLGKVYFVHEDFWPLNTSLWVKEFRRALPVYAYYILQTLDFEVFNAGSAVPTLNRNHIHNLPVVLPSRNSIEKFEQIGQSLLQKKHSNEQQSRTLAELRDTLLPRLLSGELRVRDVEPLL